MFQRLLVCTDFSDGLHRLVNFVPQLASAGVKQITFLHSVPLLQERIPRENTTAIAAAQQRLEAACQNVPAGIDVRIQVESGQPIDLILRAARPEAVDLLILGTPIRDLITERLMGSTLTAVAQRSPVPLMSIRPQIIGTFTAEEMALRCQHLFRYLLVPYDGSDAAKYLIQRLKQSAQRSGNHNVETLHFCWVVDGLRRRALPEKFQIEASQKELDTLKANLEADGLDLNRVLVEVRQGDAVVEILLIAQNEDVSAIALTSDSLGTLSEWSAPSFARELLRRSGHPIIYFPPQRA
jgi:nucleotide-binding universal stress UspA family protein